MIASQEPPQTSRSENRNKTQRNESKRQTLMSGVFLWSAPLCFWTKQKSIAGKFLFIVLFFRFGQGAGICHLPPPPVGFSFDLACSSKARRFLLLIPFRGQRHHRLVLSSATQTHVCVCACEEVLSMGYFLHFFCSTVAGQGKSSIKSITGRLVKFLCGQQAESFDARTASCQYSFITCPS